jgi:stage V sporulation protein R
MVKQKLLMQLTNMGQPRIRLIDANAGNQGNLLLEHEHRGIDLDPNYTREVLTNLYQIWTRPVAIQTRDSERNKPLLVSFDGKELKEEEMEEPSEEKPKKEK